MPLEPLNFPIFQKVVPSTLLRHQTSILDQLPNPDRRHAENLSGLFCRNEAHLGTGCKPRPIINQLQLSGREIFADRAHYLIQV
jgi:hypothetical protein